MTENTVRLTLPHPELLLKLETPFIGAFAADKFLGWADGLEGDGTYR